RELRRAHGAGGLHYQGTSAAAYWPVSDVRERRLDSRRGTGTSKVPRLHPFPEEGLVTMRPDDCTIDANVAGEIQQHVERALKDSGAYGILPTPVDKIVAQAKLSVDKEISLDAGFFAKLYRAADATIRRAVSKVLGLLDVKARRIYLDHTVHQK